MTATSVSEGVQPPPNGEREERAPASPAAANEERPAQPLPRHRATIMARLTSGSRLAVVAYLLTLPVAYLLVKGLDLNPISVRGSTMPMIVGAVVLVGVLLASRRWWRVPRVADALVGVLAGLYAGWLALIAKQALHGTPHGFGGLQGDPKRVVAMAVRYTTSWGSADLFTPGQPSEYPPLFPWVVGHASVLLHREPWRLIATAEILTLSGAVVVSFLLWRRLLSGPAAGAAALGLAVVGMVVFHDYPSKSYEVIVLVTLLPWILATFARPPRGRLHWLAAGVIGGLMLLTYNGFFIFAAPGILAIAWHTWRAEEQRRAYLRHLALTAATGMLVTSWYVLPYLWAVLTRPTTVVADTYQSAALGANPVPMPFLAPNLVGLVCLVGLIGLVWLNKPAGSGARPIESTWWAWPLLAMLIGTYVFIAYASLLWSFTHHNAFVMYATRVATITLLSAAVLSLAELWRRLPDLRYTPMVKTSLVVLGVALAISFTLTIWREWMPTQRPVFTNPTVDRTAMTTEADAAAVEPFPDGKLPRHAPLDALAGWLPINDIRAAVTARFGAGYQPQVLTVDERVFAYEPWYQYVVPASVTSPTLSDWATRFGAVKALATTTDPAQFAAANLAMPYTPIDVFILRKEIDAATGAERLRFMGGPIFARSQFASTAFDVIDLPNNYVMAIRRP